MFGGLWDPTGQQLKKRQPIPAAVVFIHYHVVSSSKAVGGSSWLMIDVRAQLTLGSAIPGQVAWTE